MWKNSEMFSETSVFKCPTRIVKNLVGDVRYEKKKHVKAQKIYPRGGPNRIKCFRKYSAGGNDRANNSVAKCFQYRTLPIAQESPDLPLHNSRPGKETIYRQRMDHSSGVCWARGLD